MKRFRNLIAIWCCRNMSKLTSNKIEVLGKIYYISKKVFNSKLWQGSPFMAENIRVNAEDDVLDMGTGCGIQAIVAGKIARSVVAVDISEESVCCAKINVKQYGLEHKVTVLHGDLFSPIKVGHKFDVILFSPPSLEGVPHSEYEQTYLDSNKQLIHRFFRDAKKHLKSNGYVQMVYSSVADSKKALSIACDLGWTYIITDQKRIFVNTLGIYKLTPCK